MPHLFHYLLFTVQTNLKMQQKNDFLNLFVLDFVKVVNTILFKIIKAIIQSL